MEIRQEIDGEGWWVEGENLPRTRVINEPYWEGDDYCLQTESGLIRCKNAYPTSIKFGELDYDSSEQAMIELTQRYN